MKRKKSKFRIFIVLFFVFLAVLIMGYFFMTSIFNSEEKEILPTLTNEEVNVEEESVILFVLDSDMKHLVQKKVNIKKVENKKEKMYLIFDALKYDENSIIPKGTKLLNIFENEDVLYLNFSKDLYNVSKDSTSEMLLVYSIVNTYCSIDGVSKVKILVDNKEINTLAGFVNLKNFFEKDMLLIQGE